MDNREAAQPFDIMMYENAEPSEIDATFGAGTYDSINNEAGNSFAGLNDLATKEGLTSVKAGKYTDRQLIVWIANKRRS